MEYKALYRKYRPDNFNDVVGQDANIKTLQNIVKENKVSHAYLFAGPRGTGKTSVAKLFAKAINCVDSKNGVPCNTCNICKLIKEDKINDIIEIDAASNNGVDEIRELKSKINLAPTICKYKVYIIDEVHMLSIGAFNALLKTLEEPPHHAIFILATTEIHKLPLTIISRCQSFNFKKITEEQMKSRLLYIAEHEKINIEEDAVNEIAKVSDGGMRDAIGLLEQLCSFTNNKITLNDVQLLSSSISRDEIALIIEKVITNNIEETFKEVEKIYQEGKDFVRITEDLIVFLKDILLYRKAKDYFKSINSYNMGKYNNLISKLGDNLIYNFINELSKTEGELKVSSHPKTIFEILLLKIADISKGTSVMDLEDNTSDNMMSTKEESAGDEMIKSQEIKPVKQEQSSVTNTLIETNASDAELLSFINLPLYKKILINNTLAAAEKEMLKDLQSKREQLQTFLINKDFKQAATILLDGKIVGASNNTIIYVFPYDAVVEKADALQSEIELLMKNIIGSKFRIINITDNNWQEIRPYYVKLMKEKQKIEILPEIDINVPKKGIKSKRNSKEIEEAITMFGEDLIEIK